MPDVIIKNEFVNANNAKDKFKSDNINKDAIVVTVKYKNGLFGMGHVDDHENLLNIISKPINEGISKNGVISSLKVFYNAVEIEPVIENIKKQFSDVTIEHVKVNENYYIFRTINYEHVNKEDYKSDHSQKIKEEAVDKEVDNGYIDISRSEIQETESSSIKTGYRCRMQ